VYSPELEIVPVVEFPPVAPSTDHVTLVLDVPDTVSLNCCVPPVVTVALVGLIATLTPELLVTVTAALACFVVSAELVTVTVCEPAELGAV
jgi:hypothetical protein